MHQLYRIEVGDLRLHEVKGFTYDTRKFDEYSMFPLFEISHLIHNNEMKFLMRTKLPVTTCCHEVLVEHSCFVHTMYLDPLLQICQRRLGEEFNHFKSQVNGSAEILSRCDHCTLCSTYVVPSRSRILSAIFS